MAGSRLDRIGNFFSRMTGLLRTGAVKYEERPLWYDVYRVFPPKYEPRYEREIEECGEVQPVLYDEDLVKAKLFKKYGLNPGGIVRELHSTGKEDVVQKFVSAFYSKKAENPQLSDDEIFDSVSNTFVFPRTPYRRLGPRRSVQDYQSTLTAPTFRARRQEQNDEDVLLETETDTLNTRYRSSTKIITQDSLLALFKEAQESQEKDPKPTGKPTKSEEDK